MERAAIEYIAAMSEQLSRLPVTAGAETLAYILALAAEEARQLISR